MFSVIECLQSWNVDEEVISVVRLTDGTEWVKWVWHDGGEEFVEYLKLETAAQELEEYYNESALAALIREYQAQGN